MIKFMKKVRHPECQNELKKLDLLVIIVLFLVLFSLSIAIAAYARTL